MLDYLPSEINEIYINKDLQKNKSEKLLSLAKKRGKAPRVPLEADEEGHRMILAHPLTRMSL